MITTTNQEFIEITVASSKRTSKNNPLAILFFIMGAPHIYAMMQRGSAERKLVKNYLTIGLGVFVAGILEICLF